MGLLRNSKPRRPIYPKVALAAHDVNDEDQKPWKGRHWRGRPGNARCLGRLVCVTYSELYFLMENSFASGSLVRSMQKKW